MWTAVDIGPAAQFSRKESELHLEKSAFYNPGAGVYSNTEYIVECYTLGFPLTFKENEKEMYF